MGQAKLVFCIYKNILKRKTGGGPYYVSLNKKDKTGKSYIQHKIYENRIFRNLCTKYKIPFKMKDNLCISQGLMPKAVQQERTRMPP